MLRYRIKKTPVAITATAACLLAFNTMAPLAQAQTQAQAGGKAITIVLGEEPDVMDGCNSQSSAPGPILQNNVVEGLTQIDTKTGAITPRLATSWEMLDDKTWRFKLRPGVVFHDGAKFDAEAAAYGIKRTLDPKLACTTYSIYFGNVKLTPKVVDALTLDLVSDKPQPILPTYMAWLGLVSPNTPADKQIQTSVGTGPYAIDKIEFGKEINLKRNDKWWGPKPQAEAVRYVWRKETSVRAAMVKIGEADLATTIAQQDTEPAATGFRDVSYSNAETASMRIDTTVAPLNDRRLRVALNMAIDRNALRGTIFPKDVQLATNLVLPTVNGYNPNLTPWPYDPAKAKQLIAEAKADGVAVDKEILVNGRTNLYPNSQEAMEAMMAMWTAVGFKIKLNMMEVGTWQKWNIKPFPEDRGPSMLQTRHNNQSGDVEFSAFILFACDGRTSPICAPELDAKIAKATLATGQPRVEAWQDVMKDVYEKYVTNVILYHLVAFARIGNRIDYAPNFLTGNIIDLPSITFR